MAERMLAFLADTWQWWAIYAGVSLAGYTLYYFLFAQRIYRAVNGKAQIKHGRLGHWQDLEEHLRKEHSEVT